MLTIDQIEKAANLEHQIGTGCASKNSTRPSKKKVKSINTSSENVNDRNDVLTEIKTKFVTAVDSRGKKILKQIS